MTLEEANQYVQDVKRSGGSDLCFPLLAHVIQNGDPQDQAVAAVLRAILFRIEDIREEIAADWDT